MSFSSKLQKKFETVLENVIALFISPIDIGRTQYMVCFGSLVQIIMTICKIIKKHDYNIILFISTSLFHHITRQWFR